MSVGDLFAIVRRRRTISAVSAILTFLVVVVYTFTRTPMYQANASLAADRTRKPVEFVADPDSSRLDLNMLNTERDLMMSNVVLEQAVRSSSLPQSPAYAGAANPAAVLRQRLDVITAKETWIIYASLVDEDPRQAEQGLQAVLDAFMDLKSRHQKESTFEGLDFLKEQVEDSARKLDKGRELEQKFRVEHNILSSDPELNFIARRLFEMDAHLVDLRIQLASSNEVVKQLQDIDSLPEDRRFEALLGIEAINHHHLVISQSQEVFHNQSMVASLSKKFGDKHPRMIELREILTTSQVLLKKTLDHLRSSVESENRRLQNQNADLEKDIAEAKAALTIYKDDLVVLDEMNKRGNLQAKLHELLVSRLAQEHVTASLSIQKLMVIDTPRASAAPVNIRRSLFLTLAVFLAALSAVAVPTAIEILDRRIRGATAVREATGRPILGEVPLDLEVVPLGSEGRPESPPSVAEAFSQLRAALGLVRGDATGCCQLLVTSSSPNEGKSTIAARLAISFASSGMRVLLVDADLRNPTLDEQIGAVTERGFGALLMGEPEIAPVQTRFPNLEYIGAGPRPDNPAELLHSHCLREWLAHCRDFYDYVIMDSPPLLLAADGLVIGSHVDGILFVVRDSFTTKTGLSVAMERLQPLAPRVLGVVLNAKHGRSIDYRYPYPRHGQRLADSIDEKVPAVSGA